MKDLPVGKIRGLGGKLGRAVAEFGCTTAGEVQLVPLTKLQQRFGDQTGLWLYRICRGVCMEEVQHTLHCGRACRVVMSYGLVLLCALSVSAHGAVGAAEFTGQQVLQAAATLGGM